MTRLIVVDATPYGREPSGARRRAEALLPRVARLLPGDVFEVHWADDGGGPGAGVEADNLVHVEVGVSCHGGAWRWRRVRRHLERRLRAAAFTHVLVDHGPLVAPETVPNIVTLHDLRFLHGWGGALRKAYGRWLYPRRLAKAHAVVAVSRSVADEARRVFPRARVVLAPNAVGPTFHRPAPGSVRRGALVVARDEKRKARGAAVEACRQAGVDLRVVDGGLSDAELAEAYHQARWLLAPSLDEGFDLPVAEALACGTHVIASDIPAHRDQVALGARGLFLVPPPRPAGGTWDWPGAVEILRGAGGACSEGVEPPATTWDEAAECIAQLIRNSGMRR